MSEQENPVQVPEEAGIVNYKCPNCGGPLAFGIESQQWDCHFCASSFAREEFEKFGTETDSSAESWSVESEQFDAGQMTAYTCPSCGGSVVCEGNTAATHCVYCHSPSVIAANLSGEYRPAKLVPFSKTKENALESLQKMCKGKLFLPPAFRHVVDKGEITGLYVPYWLYSARFDAMMHATATRVRTWSDSNYRYTKTDTYRVERAGQIPFQHVPVDASSRMPDALMDAIEPFEYKDLTDFRMQYLSGHQAESYDEDSEQCSGRFMDRALHAVESTLRNTVQGYSTVRVNSLQHHVSDKESMYVMLPVWMVNLPWKGKTYSFAMNGQTGKVVGKLPLSWGKVCAWFGSVLGGGFLLALIGGLLF